MGRQDYSDIGYGMTEQEARQDAYKRAENEYGHQEGYSGHINSDTREVPIKVKCLVKPVKGKRGKVEKTIQKGTRKWVTVYEISNSDESVFEVVKNSQADAIKRAKELADKHCQRMYINIAKHIEKGESLIAKVSPPNHIMGKYIFSGTARC